MKSVNLFRKIQKTMFLMANSHPLMVIVCHALNAIICCMCPSYKSRNCVKGVKQLAQLFVIGSEMTLHIDFYSLQKSYNFSHFAMGKSSTCAVQ